MNAIYDLLLDFVKFFKSGKSTQTIQILKNVRKSR